MIYILWFKNDKNKFQAKRSEDPVLQQVKAVNIDRLVTLAKKVYMLFSFIKNDNTKLRIAGQLVDVCAMIKDTSSQ